MRQEGRRDDTWVVGGAGPWRRFRGAPTREMLDAVLPDRPAVLDSADGHTAWANSKALELAGVIGEHAQSRGRAHRP